MRQRGNFQLPTPNLQTGGSPELGLDRCWMADPFEFHPGGNDGFVWELGLAIGSWTVSSYSVASANTGSIFVTRRAGRKLAMRLATDNVTVTATKTARSRGST